MPDLPTTAVVAPGSSGRRDATKAANRAAILAAAREVFVDLGYGAATVRDIVRRTGAVRFVTDLFVGGIERLRAGGRVGGVG